MPSPRSLCALAVAVAAWVALGALVPAEHVARTTADEPQYLMTAISLGEDGNLDVADERAAQRFRAFHRADLPQQEAVRDDGSLVSPHDPLLPAVLAAPMRAGGWVAAKLTLAALAGALAAALVWVATHRFAVPTRVAVVTVAAFSAAAPLAVYGTQVYPELPAALAVTVAIGALTGTLDGRGRAVAIAALVALPWLSVKYTPVVAALTLLALVRLVREGRRSHAVAFATGLGAAAALFAAAHVAWYGGLTPYASGTAFSSGEFTVVGGSPNYVGRSIRLVGLLIDRDFGLAAWQPAFLLAVAAFVALVRDRPRGWLVLALPFLAGWCNATFVALTMAGWWFPGRQVVVVLPCAVLAIAWWAAQRPHRVAYLVAGAVVGASVFAWFVAQGASSDLTFAVSFESISHPLVNGWRLLLPDYRDGAALDWVRHGCWLAVLALVGLKSWNIRLVPDRVAHLVDARRRTTGALVDA